MRGARRALAAGLLLLGLAACASPKPFMVASRPPPQAESLGPVEASACGSQLLFLIPDPRALFEVAEVGTRGRIERAYAAALSQAPGARSLTRVEVEERWAWWLLGATRCVTLRGEAIR